MTVTDTSAPGRHLLSDGTRISEERRLVADAAAAGAKMASDDGRANGLDFAPHAPQQALLFPPSYEDGAPPRRKGPDAIQRTNTRFAPPPPPSLRGRTSSAV